MKLGVLLSTGRFSAYIYVCVYVYILVSKESVLIQRCTLCILRYVFCTVFSQLTQFCAGPTWLMIEFADPFMQPVKSHRVDGLFKKWTGL